jgi:hypothetical protein
MRTWRSRKNILVKANRSKIQGTRSQSGFLEYDGLTAGVCVKNIKKVLKIHYENIMGPGPEFLIKSTTPWGGAFRAFKLFAVPLIEPLWLSYKRSCRLL